MKRIAVIELDVRSCKLLVVDYNENALVSVIDEMSEPLKLWADVEVDNVIKPARTSETITVIQNFKKRLELLKVGSVIAYCTPSFREIKNHRSFIEEVSSDTSYKFEIIQDEKLASAVHLINANTIEPIKAVTVDIQDDYILIVKYNRRNILDTYKFDFGTLTLAKEYEDKTEMSTSEKMEKMIKYAKSQFAKCDLFSTTDDEFKKIGMGSAFVNAGRLTKMSTKYPINLDHNYELTVENFEKAYEVVKNLTVDKTKKIKGVSAERADTVVSGFAIIKALMESYDANMYQINELGCQNGLVYMEMNDDLGDRPIGDILTQSLESCNLFYDKEEHNAKGIFTFANDLFDELRVLHRFTKNQQRILKIASFMANSGKRINTRNFEKLGFSIVLNSEIYGATHREILVAGFVCASQNLDDFDFASWVRYKDIVEDGDVEIVKKMGVLVKIARLIDQSKTADHIACDVLGDKCILNVVPKANCQCMLDDVRKASADFKRAFNKYLQVL